MNFSCEQTTFQRSSCIRQREKKKSFDNRRGKLSIRIVRKQHAAWQVSSHGRCILPTRAYRRWAKSVKHRCAMHFEKKRRSFRVRIWMDLRVLEQHILKIVQENSAGVRQPEQRRFLANVKKRTNVRRGCSQYGGRCWRRLYEIRHATAVFSRFPRSLPSFFVGVPCVCASLIFVDLFFPFEGYYSCFCARMEVATESLIRGRKFFFRRSGDCWKSLVLVDSELKFF